MKKKLFIFPLLFLFVMGCAMMMDMTAREKVYGKAAPVITDSFASKELMPGDTWKVYLKASDPDGDMDYVISEIYQPGVGDYPISFTRIREGNGRELNGYVYLNTLGSMGSQWENFWTITLTVFIKDKAGHYSKPVAFQVTFQGRSSQEPPPSGVFQEQDLGPILVTLHPITDGNHGDRDN